MIESQKVDRAYGFFHGHWDVDRDLGHKQAGHTCDHCTFAPDGVLLLYHGLIFKNSLRKKTVKPLRSDSLKYFASK